MPRPALALIISEDEWSVRSFESVLAPNGYAILRAYTAQQAFQQIRGTAPDVIVVDSSLPDMDATGLCSTLHDDPRISASTPILFTTSGPSVRQKRLEALRAGAWDFIAPPIDPEELLLRLNTYTEAKLEAEATREEALVDTATGLYSTRGLLRRVRELASAASRHHRPIACIVLAPDKGAAERDAQSAEAVQPGGDEDAIIDHLANVFRSTIRESDVLGRLGEQEFVLLAPDTNSDGARVIGERLARAIERGAAAQEPEGESVAKKARTVNLRAGCYAVPDLHEAGVQPTDILARATIALRQAQAENDAGPVHFYEPLPPPSLS